MLESEFVEYYKNNAVLSTNSYKLVVPKRYYKRADLQRLSNRWYGLKDTGLREVTITASPKVEKLRVVNTKSSEPFVVGKDFSDRVELIETVYTFPKLAYVFRLPQREFKIRSEYYMKMFWESLRPKLVEYYNENF